MLSVSYPKAFNWYGNFIAENENKYPLWDHLPGALLHIFSVGSLRARYYLPFFSSAGYSLFFPHVQVGGH